MHINKHGNKYFIYIPSIIYYDDQWNPHTLKLFSMKDILFANQGLYLYNTSLKIIRYYLKKTNEIQSSHKK